MPSWSDLLDDLNRQKDFMKALTDSRHDYLRKVSAITGRNTIAYYSGWLKDPEAPNITINDNDKNAFMNAVYGMDRSKGLDLILHTPGGDIAATESIVSYLKSLFNSDIRAIVPQISMSAGTMIAMSCKSVMMGRQSSLGPIDPQHGGIACQAVIDEFYKAIDEIKSEPASLGLWQVIFSQLHPTFITSCEDAIKWSAELAEKWLKEVKPDINIEAINNTFLNHKNSYSHSRHISREDCRAAGITIENLEDDNELQDAVLSLHHCYMILIDVANVAKIVENQNGKCYLQQVGKKA